ncbi:MAG: exo-alpha-sialidase [Clostridiales bacterium]|nr:exo-alpha-sialidase [Clostridiales bacterium]
MRNLTLEKKSFVFNEGELFDSCHASTLAALPDGDMLVACFGGTEEGADDVAIYLRRVSGGEALRVCVDENLPHWNPVLYMNAGGEIILFFKVGSSPREWYTMYCLSSDGGKSFSSPEISLPKGCRGPVRNKPIRLSNGTLIAGSSVETETEWQAFSELSDGEGVTWSTSHIPGYVENERMKATDRVGGVIQPTLWEDDSGVHMFLRSSWGRIYRCDSSDSGRSWGKAYETPFPNNNSGIDLVKLSCGGLALVMNPVGTNWGARTPLQILLSDNGGESFYTGLTLESEEGEFSYPAIIAEGDTLHVTYTYNRKNIMYAKVNIG